MKSKPKDTPIKAKIVYGFNRVYWCYRIDITVGKQTFRGETEYKRHGNAKRFAEKMGFEAVED